MPAQTPEQKLGPAWGPEKQPPELELEQEVPEQRQELELRLPQGLGRPRELGYRWRLSEGQSQELSLKRGC